MSPSADASPWIAAYALQLRNALQPRKAAALG